MEKMIGPKTLREIDERIPDALRVAFGIRHRSLPAPAPGEHDEVASFAAALLAPREDGVGVSLERNDDDAPQRALRMQFESCYLKDHDEDAHFGHAGTGVLGVADGVGGYRKRGVDAGAFARAVMDHAFLEVVSAPPGTPVCPHTLLERAYQATAASLTPAASTAVILSLAGRTLRWAYVGDSGFAVFRDGRLLRRSQAQQRYFNCPVQLKAEGGSATAADAEVGEVAAKEGDVVVVGTDGLFDNVSDDEMERIVRMGAAMGFSPRNMADVIAGFAYEAARCSYRDTPFSIQSRRERGTTFTGGKPDDITVIVAFIVQFVRYLIPSSVLIFIGLENRLHGSYTIRRTDAEFAAEDSANPTLVKDDENATATEMAVTVKLNNKPQTASTVDERTTQKTAGTAVAQSLKKIKQSLSKAVACFHPSVLQPVSKDSDDDPAEDEDVPAAQEGGGHDPVKEAEHAPPPPKGCADSPRKEAYDVPAPKGGCDCPGKEVDDVPAKDDSAETPCPEHEATPRAPRMDVASCYVPDHDEDAHFTVPDAGVVGVADGVGGYRKKGVDAGAFARALMANASAAASRTKPDTPICPQTLLRRAYDATSRSRTPGASTAIILSLDGATLKWAYVGDSGFAVLRGSEIIRRSTPQLHHRNCPYQLRARKSGDSVSKAEVGDMPVRDGDVVVVGTDGLFDNVSGEVLESLARQGTEMGWSAQVTANVIAGVARMTAKKMDDITVVVLFIVKSDW
ncbi:hypothetical protein EJB05_20643, partial [Eragrostis curvula]